MLAAAAVCLGLQVRGSPCSGSGRGSPCTGASGPHCKADPSCPEHGGTPPHCLARANSPPCQQANTRHRHQMCLSSQHLSLLLADFPARRSGSDFPEQNLISPVSKN
ncbi:hypothetical protein AV530_014678 [Patagioenas fasciata monilis]|uniref:Uncharacterized protein n=1 Tax=Patagioenas fasciata monilis TaxID=372326 RepID=A0A1V4KBE6_PATFA|nr:hypothetical protein AV530_014678 [Patagioenas fasciata monilis]